MGLQIYKPTPKVSGTACSFSFRADVAKTRAEAGTADRSVYVEFIKQTKWNQATRTGVFKGGEQTNLKFSLTEAADMLRALETNTPAFPQAKLGDDGKPRFGAFHKSEAGMTSIRFEPYIKPDGTQPGFSFSVNKKEGGKDKNFLIGFTFAEMKLIEKYLNFCLTHIFTAIYSEDKKMRDEAYKERAKAAGKDD